MSFEVFVQCFDRGEPAGLPWASIRRLFPVVDAESEPDNWSVRYDALNRCSICVSPLESDTALVESLCVFRPCGDLRLWEALLAVMRLGAVVLYFPGNAPPLIASGDVAQHLPDDMIESLGQPKVVQSGQEIVEVIERA
jgi:hypothetical protein